MLLFKILTGLSDAVIALNSASVRFVKKNSATQMALIPNFDFHPIEAETSNGLLRDENGEQ